MSIKDSSSESLDDGIVQNEITMNVQHEITRADLEQPLTLSEKELMESPEAEELARQVMSDHGVDLGPARVGYFLVYPNLSKTRAAACMKANREVKYYSGNDYLIEISGDLWDMLDDATKKMIIYHQLLHIDPVFQAKSGQWKMMIRKPDFADFYEIHDKFGNEWYKTVQATMSSLYDLDPRQEGRVSL